MCRGELGVSFITAECLSEGFKSRVALNREGFWTNQVVVRTRRHRRRLRCRRRRRRLSSRHPSFLPFRLRVDEEEA